MPAAFFLLIFSALAPSLGGAATIDERHPGYQAYILGLADADRAVTAAMRSLEAARASYEIPGVDIEKMVQDLRRIDETLRLVITPEKVRTEYQTLVPDGTYFTAPATPRQ